MRSGDLQRRAATLARLRHAPILALARRPATLAVLGYTLLAVAWAMSNAPFGAPDEPAHYVRALGVSEGHVIGTHVTIAPSDQPDPVIRAWVQDETRALRVPAGLSPVGYTCMAFEYQIPASCQFAAHPAAVLTTFASTAGTFQPLPYLLPAAVVRLDSHPAGALRLARLAALLPCLVLIAAALLVLVNGDALGLVGPLVALTPQVIFMSASLSEDGIEMASSIAWTAALIALSRERSAGMTAGRLRRRWLFAGIAGLLLALSRSLGPGWIATDLACVLLVLGWRAPWTAARATPRTAAAAAVAVVGGVVINRIWEAAYASYPHIGLIPSRTALHHQVVEGSGLFATMVARFGWLDTFPPWPLVALWGVLAFTLIAVAVRVSGRRARFALPGVSLAVLLGSVWFSAVMWDASHFEIQGRDVLAGIVVLPLLAGELIRRRRSALGPHLRRALLPVTAALVALVQLWCFFVNGQRNAVGSLGRRLFFLAPKWSPPAGWYPWLVLALGGCAAVALAGWRAGNESTGSRAVSLAEARPRRAAGAPTSA